MEKNNLIKESDLVKVRVVRDEVILHNINMCNRKPVSRRIGNGKRVNIQTGEITEEKKTSKRGESLYILLESNIKLQDLIKENTVNLNHILLITFTYREKTLDMKKINEDFKSFMKRLRRRITEFGTIEYINTLELDNGGYHIHAIIFFNESKKIVYIPDTIIAEIWGHGFIKFGKKPKTKKDVYYYVTPHLSNEVTNKNSHMHYKALMQMELPTGQNLYRYSKGLKKPVIHTDTYENVKKYLKENSYVFERKNVYLNPMHSHRGNNLYYCKEYYKKERTKSYGLGKRTPI